MSNRRPGENGPDWAEYSKYKLDPKTEAMYNEKMRSLLTRSIDLKEASERGDDSCIQEATNIILQADDILRKAKCSSTAYLDAQILNTSSLIYKNCIEKMDSRISEFKPSEYAENLIAYLENKAGGASIWEALEEETASAFNDSGGWTWQLGAIDIDEIYQEQRQRKPKRENLLDAPTKNPKKVNHLDKEEEDLEHHMQAIMTVLCKWERKTKEPLQFWDLALHPTSFSETIENLFHISHLVHENLVYICLDRDGLPIIRTNRKTHGKDGGEIQKIPIAVTIDMKQWEALVDAFEVSEPMIPARNHKPPNAK